MLKNAQKWRVFVFHLKSDTTNPFRFMKQFPFHIFFFFNNTNMQVPFFGWWRSSFFGNWPQKHADEIQSILEKVFLSQIRTWNEGRMHRYGRNESRLFTGRHTNRLVETTNLTVQPGSEGGQRQACRREEQFWCGQTLLLRVFKNEYWVYLVENCQLCTKFRQKRDTL